MKINIYNIKLIAFLGVALSLSSCEDYLDIPAPSNAFYEENTFVNDATTATTINGVLAQLSVNYYLSNLSLYTGLYTDEFTLNLNNAAFYQRFYNNDLNSNQAPSVWSDFYPLVYRVNAIIEGINDTSATLSNKDQYLGEAYFLRAFSFYYLTNIYGDIALPTTSDYEVNNTLSRQPQEEAFQQIIADLEMAESLLSESYVTSDGLETSSQARPNKTAAQALLSRVLLQTENWEEAAEISSAILDQSGQSLVDTENVFKTDSGAMIWELMPNNNPDSYMKYVPDYNIYFGWNYGFSPVEVEFGNAPVYLSESQLDVFEEGDLRFQNWVYPVELPDTTYYLPYKYQTQTAGEEASAILRIAEQYLINAEANAEMGDLGAAVTSINAVRNRAGLPDITANSSEEVLAAIAKERRTEFFAEGGYRFFDLKRTNTIDEVMNDVVTDKTKFGEVTWDSYKQFWPISYSEINANPNLEQTEGY
ncbi:RagB/SusD family nutrient uptake outer membrane protein [Zunongwangia endophytica]|uniref:RagB/SusD family nutrient uptake outer membrane protein n=1 Tax=Zunongwangia endophytica TaxID=1808945 RepID=A0ABV8H7Q5_9FLAO|nr:RagB/SusD family nutrient uptake outer membrane protein [Zunongwangia endophytica]MDN3595230.1 RagB/SusD family nutrient uptake outer membrane protein [Zunongwangia endophytica]